MNINYLSFFLILISQVSSLFFILDPLEKRCIYRDLLSNTVFSGTFFISGEHEEGSRTEIKNEQGSVLWQALGKKHDEFKVDINKEGVYMLCIESISNIQLTASFEFYDDKKQDQLITVQNVENLNSVVHTIRRKLDIVHSNMRNSAVRREVHLNISNSINSKITVYTAIKIVFLIFFSVFQVMMLTSIFGNVKVMNKISLSNNIKSDSEMASINSTGENNLFL